MARAGKVAITPKGTFENGTVYEKLDTVEYNGTLYIAKKASSGVLPTDTEYWMLAVDLTGKMDTTGDSKNNIVTFTSADATDPTGWQDVQVLTSKEKHLSLFNKISTMMSNMRYLYKILGTTDISALGSVTQAIANLNSNVGGIKGISSSAAITTQGQYALDAREKNASVDGTLANKIDVLNSNLQNGLIDYKWKLEEYTMDLSTENYQFKQEIKSYSSKVIFTLAQLQYSDSVYSNKPFIFCNPTYDNNVSVTIMTENIITEKITYKYYLLVALER